MYAKKYMQLATYKIKKKRVRIEKRLQTDAIWIKLTKAVRNRKQKTYWKIIGEYCGTLSKLKINNIPSSVWPVGRWVSIWCSRLPGNTLH